MGFPNLTEAQRESLFELVKHEQETGREQVYHSVGSTILSGDPSFRVEDVPLEVIQMWFERDYATGLSYEGDRLHGPHLNFVLSQDALEYRGRMSKPKSIRALLNWWDGASGDARTTLFGLVGGVIGAILIAAIGQWLGL